MNIPETRQWSRQRHNLRRRESFPHRPAPVRHALPPCPYPSSGTGRAAFRATDGKRHELLQTYSRPSEPIVRPKPGLFRVQKKAPAPLIHRRSCVLPISFPLSQRYSNSFRNCLNFYHIYFYVFVLFKITEQKIINSFSELRINVVILYDLAGSRK